MKLLLFLLTFSISTVFAQKSTHTIDIENKKCHKNAIPTTKAAIECERKALLAWEKEMNIFLNRLRSKGDQFDVVSLNASQKKWNDFFEADVVLYNSYLYKLYEGGTLSRVAILTYQKEQMRKRVLVLKSFFENLE